MPMTPELAEAFAASPLFTQPLPPPPGVPLHQYAREQANAVLKPWVEHFRERAPSGMRICICSVLSCVTLIACIDCSRQ